MDYYSLDGLSTRSNDILNVLIIPMVNVYIMICYLISSIVLSSKNLKGEINRLLLVNSVTGVIMFALSNSSSITRCGTLCPWGYEYYSKAFELYIYLFVGRSAEVFGILTELNMLFLKLRSFSAKRRTGQSKILKHDKIKFILLISSYWLMSFIFFYLPTFYGRSIIKIGNLISNKTINGNDTIKIIQRSLFILYKDNTNDLVNILIQLFFPSILLLLYLVIMVLNSIIAYKLIKFLRNKTNELGKSKIFILFY